jgi:hypothetical protein
LRRRSCRQECAVGLAWMGSTCIGRCCGRFCAPVGVCCIYMVVDGFLHGIVWRFCTSWACIGRSICIGRRLRLSIDNRLRRGGIASDPGIERDLSIFVIPSPSLLHNYFPTPLSSPLFPPPTPTNPPLPNTSVPHLSHPCPDAPTPPTQMH